MTDSALKHSQLVMPADLSETRQLGPWLAQLLPNNNDLQEKLELALHELCVNVIEHAIKGPGSIQINATVDNQTVVIETFDSGDPVDLDNIKEPNPDEPQVRGYGLMIIKQLVDSFTYQRLEGTNKWAMSASIRPTNSINSH